MDKLSFKKFLGNLFVALSLFLPLACPAYAEEDPIELDWKFDFDEAALAAKTASMPILIEFVRVDNRDCQRMEKTLGNLKVIQDFLDKCILCRLDADQKKSIQVMNRFGLEGVGIPFIVLLGKDWQVKGTHGGYASPEAFLGAFSNPLIEALKEREKTRAELLAEHIDSTTRAADDRRYGKAIGHITEVLKIAHEMKADTLRQEAQDNLRDVIQLGMDEINKAKQKAAKTKNYAEAIAILKRVQIDFDGRAPTEEASKALEAYKANPAIADLVEKTEAAPEGYDTPAPTKKETPEAKKPKKAKTMVKLELKGGKELYGTIVTEDKGKIFFRPDSQDPKERTPRFINRSEILRIVNYDAEQEAAEKTGE